MDKYTLYIGSYKELSDEIEYSYYSTESKYMLAYHNKPIDCMQAVPLEKQSRLTQEEKAWLFMTKQTVNMKAQTENLADITDKLQGFLSVFEKELKAETKKSKG